MLNKLLRFCVETHDNDGNILLFNSLNGKILAIPKKFEKEYLSFKNSEMQIASQKLYLYMRTIGFLHNEADAEVSNIEQRYKSFVLNKEKLHLTILPTDACNFKCVYCYQSEPYTFMNEATADRVYKFIKTIAKPYKTLYISWFGGEPLLNCDVMASLSDKLIRFANSEGKPYVAEITTNGYLLDVEMFETLLKRKILYYQITLDANEDIHNKTRPHKIHNDSFQKIYQNLLNIKNNCNKRFLITIRINLSAQNHACIKEALNLFKKDFGNDTRFNFALQPVKDWGGKRIQKVKKEMVRDFSVFYNDMEYINDIGLPFFDNKFLKFGNILCNANMKHNFVIDPIGQLQKCTIALYDPVYKSINTVGRIDENGIGCYDEKALSKWRERRIYNACKECNIYPLCYCATCPFAMSVKTDKYICDKNERIEYVAFYLRNWWKNGLIREVYNG